MSLIGKIIKRNQWEMLIDRRRIHQIREDGHCWHNGHDVTAWVISMLRQHIRDLASANVILRRHLPYA